MKFLCTLLFVVLAFVACHTASDTDDALPNPDSAALVKDVAALAGIFYDTLSCKDCPGAATSLYLKPDSTFVMEQRHNNKVTHYTTGTWIMNDSIVQMNSTDSIIMLQIVNFAQLQLLHPATLADGSAPKATLRRNNSAFKPLLPIPVEGMYSARGDTMNLHICSMDKDYPASLAPTALRMKGSYQKATSAGTPLFAKVAATSSCAHRSPILSHAIFLL